jgi:twinfilin
LFKDVPKMLYASTRASLMKTLGSALFTDSIFATSKSDLSIESYHAHRQHVLAPKPLSSREQELSDLRQAESTTADYSGSRQRVNHIGTGIGMPWSSNAEEALAELAAGQISLVVLVSCGR